MRVFLAAAAMTAAAAAEPFEITVVAQAGQRTIAVHDVQTGRKLVAAGGEKLRLLDQAEAEAVYLRVVEQDLCAPPKPAEATIAPQKIIIHKMDYDEDPVDVRGDRQTRSAGRDRIREALREDDGADATIIRSGDDEPSAAVRVTRLAGAGKVEAAQFIDALEGLDPAAAAEIGDMLAR